MLLIAALEDLWEQLLASRREVSRLIFHRDKQTLTRLNSACQQLPEIIITESYVSAEKQEMNHFWSGF